MIFGIIFNKLRNELLKKSFLICIFFILISFIFYCNTTARIENSSEKLISAVVAPNGKVILKSFQKSILGYSKTADFDRSPAGTGALVKKADSNIPRSIDSNEKKNGNEFNIKINGTSVYLLKDYVAVKTKSSGVNADIPIGFELRREKSTKINRIHDSEKLLVFTDRYGIEKKILTGSIIVNFEDVSLVDKIKVEYNLDIQYSAPQIKTAIYKAKNGQNVFDLQSSISKNSGVKSVKLELLGRGVVAK